MSFAGSGSGLPAFYCEDVGALLATSINKYMGNRPVLRLLRAGLIANGGPYNACGSVIVP
jgi:hypothetical protein